MSKQRWRKKIEGKDYVSDGDGAEDTDEDIGNISIPVPGNDENGTGNDTGLKPYEDYDHRRRSSVTSNIDTRSTNDIFNKPIDVPVSNHRRKRFDDLKSVQERKKEMEVNQMLMRH